MTSRHVLATVALLGGCSGTPVDEREVATIDAWVRQEQSPAATEPIAMWYGDGNVDSIVCGEIVAPPAVQAYRSTLRFVYGPPRDHRGGQVEMHEAWLATGAGQAALDANRSIFDALWNDHCASAAPPSRRLAAITGLPVHRWWREAWATRERPVDELRHDLDARRQSRGALR